MRDRTDTARSESRLVGGIDATRYIYTNSCPGAGETRQRDAMCVCSGEEMRKVPGDATMASYQTIREHSFAKGG